MLAPGVWYKKGINLHFVPMVVEKEVQVWAKVLGHAVSYLASSGFLYNIAYGF